MSRQKITFSHNWNGKLFCYAFTTFRLRNDAKYKVGQEYDIYLKGHEHEPVVISYIRHFKIDEISEVLWLLDTGYNKEESVNMMKTMYRNIVQNWETQDISFIVLRRIHLDVSQLEKPKTITYKAKPDKAA